MYALYTCVVFSLPSGSHLESEILWNDLMMMRRPKSVKLPSADEAEALVRRMRGELDDNSSYRAKSIRIHGAICAKCGREFDNANLHLLTVHHKDGNHNNNPPDGSNWENLCSHCHDDEHSRGLLGDYLS